MKTFVLRKAWRIDMAEITDIGNDRIEVKVTLKLVQQIKGDVCDGCFFNNNGNGDCPSGINGLRCAVCVDSKWTDYIWVEV
jgi:NMD protein affecting ribosome stability and mRNA decay